MKWTVLPLAGAYQVEIQPVSDERGSLLGRGAPRKMQEFAWMFNSFSAAFPTMSAAALSAECIIRHNRIANRSLYAAPLGRFMT